MKLLQLVLALFSFLLSSLPLAAQIPSDSLAELMITRIQGFINTANYDSASACGYELLAYARRHKLPLYEASAWSSLGIVAYNTNRVEDALAQFDSALYIRRRYLGDHDQEVLGTLSNIAAVLLGLKGDPDAALERLEELERICIGRKDGCAENFLGNLYNNIGNAHADRGNYELAEQSYLKSLAIRSKYPKDPRYKLASLLNNLGSLKIETGHLASAQDYLLRSEALYQEWNGGKASFDQITNWMNLGTIADFENRFSDAKALFRRALQVGKTMADDQYLEFGSLNYNLGAVLSQEDSLDAAETHYLTAIEFWKTNFGFHPDQTAAILGLGLIATKRGQYEAALIHFREAELLDETNYPPQHPRRANTYKTIGNFYDNRGDRVQARAYYLKQLKAAGMDEVRAAALRTARPSYLLLAGLTDLGKLHYDEYRQHHDTAQLAAALRVFALGDSVLNHLREIRQTFAEQKELLRDARRLAEWAMQAEIARFGLHTERAFARSEQNRAFNLYSKFREDAAVRYEGVPDSLTSKYRSLQYEIARAESLLRDMPPSDVGYIPASAHCAELRQGLAAVKTQLARFDQYYKFRFGVPVASVQDVQQKILLPGEVMAQYFVGDSALFIFVLSKDRYDIQVIPNDFQLDAKVKTLWRGITAYYSAAHQDSVLWENALNDYESNALELYHQLVAPLKLRPVDSIIVIVPDGALWLLPFDALLTSVPDLRGEFGAYPYFLNQHRTSFAYSATLLREASRPRGQVLNKTLLACAPFDQAYAVKDPSAKRKFGHLPESGWEVREAQRLLGGEVLLGPKATKRVFLSQLLPYKTLLFSTHGQAGERGFVAFFPEKDKTSEQNLLYIEEVYDLQINADLVIFSACETALGKSEPGEGLISIARAFTYAGARGIVTTLWSVNDFSNSRITVAICKHLKAGLSAQQAVCYAKRAWLESPSSEAGHPWFWAGVVGVGVLR
ncbi:MAG: CHAT domain-containing protein [Phycisphaerae bacterium]|nr:CHAT domain-containing protein [Saprospiraceae bacterium]